jgi:hypothetical protein
MPDRVIRRHRLPHPYRLCLTVFWIVPLLLFIAAIILKRGVDLALFDPRFILPALMMIAPAFYVWREGIDVLPDGIYRRMHIPQFYAYANMKRWCYERRVLRVWDRQDQIILECRAGHLTEFPALLEVVQAKLTSVQ